MNNSAAGTRVEHKVRDDLLDHGYVVYRSSASRGAADLVAIGLGEVLFVQCKRTNPQLSPADRRALVALADRLGVGGLPVVATKPPRKPIAYRLLTGTGPKDHTPYEPTDAAAVAADDLPDDLRGCLCDPSNDGDCDHGLDLGPVYNDHALPYTPGDQSELY